MVFEVVTCAVALTKLQMKCDSIKRRSTVSLLAVMMSVSDVRQSCVILQLNLSC